MKAAAIEEAVAAAGLKPVADPAADLLAQYVELLLRWNARLNLTAVRDPRQIVRRHLLECIQCAQSIPEIGTLLDFGSGAGLPGIPIAIVRPEIRVTLGESQGKKAAFLREALRVLGLKADIYDRRIENMAAELTFDAVSVRAVDRMDDAARVALERIKGGGWLVLFATVTTEQRLKAGLPEITWEDRTPVSSLETGIILLGRMRCST